MITSLGEQRERERAERERGGLYAYRAFVCLFCVSSSLLLFFPLFFCVSSDSCYAFVAARLGLSIKLSQESSGTDKEGI